MKKMAGILVCAVLLLTGSTMASVTIATFSDPSGGSSEPLFTLTTDGVSSGALNGGWDDSKTGLDLIVYENGSPSQTFVDAFFVMDTLVYSGQPSSPFFGTTTGGSIRFFEDGADINVDVPVFMITFDSASINIGNFGGSNLFFASDNVVFSGSAIQTITGEETFSFSLVNQVIQDNGFTATAAFTSSANVIPEPMSLSLMAMGLGLIRRKK